MTRMMYNWIMRKKLNPREDGNGGISNFTGRIKGMHVFVGNFTYVIDFMIVEDISSILDPRLSQVVLGRPFIEISNMTHDPPKDLEKEHTKSVYLRNEEDKRRGAEPSHECYRNTIELPDGNNVVPLRFDTIRLVQNGCSFHGLRFEDPNQHLRDFLKLVDSLDLDVANKERTRLRLFQFSLSDQACNWLERLPAGSISTWEDLTTHFLAQFFPPGRTVKLQNDILMFQQHQGESLSEAWTRFKDLLQKVPHHGIDLWLQIQIFYDHVSIQLKSEIDRAAGGKLRDKNAEESWEIIENLALYDHEGWDDPRDFAKPVKATSLP
ncbi:zinc finger, CCHC-type containing protein [Tanacetum coccineum]